MPQWALSPGEAAVLAALRATGQADGTLWDVQAVAHAAQTTPKLVIARLTTLHRKRYIAPAGVSDEAAADARRRLGALVDRLRDARARGTVPTGHFVRTLIYRLRLERAPAPRIIHRIGAMLDLSQDEIATHVRAAAILERYVHSRGRRARHPVATAPVYCNICGRLIHEAAPVRAEASPVCSECTPQRSAAVQRRGKRPDHPGGKWLYGVLETLYAGKGTAQGFVAVASRDFGLGKNTLHVWVWRPKEYPHGAAVQKIADGITRRRQILGRQETPLTSEDIMRRFGWTRTTEDEHRRRLALDRAARPCCPICGGPRPAANKQACSSACRALRQVHARGFRTDGSRYLFTIMALAGDLTPNRIASLVARPLGMVAQWAERPQVRTLAERIRAELRHGERPFRSGTFRRVARVLGLSVQTLTRYLNGTYRRPDRKRRVALRYSRRMDLAEQLGLASDEFLMMFGLKAPFVEFSRQWGRKSPPRRRPVRGRGRQPRNCLFVREILRRFRWRQKSWSEAADHADELMRKIRDHRWEDVLRQRSRRHPQHALNDPHDEKVTSIPQDELALEAKALRGRVIQHGRHCADCRPLVAMDLARAERYTQPQIADLLKCSRRTVYADLSRMEREHPRAYRFGTGGPPASKR